MLRKPLRGGGRGPARPGIAVAAAVTLALATACGGNGTGSSADSFSVGVPAWYVAHLTPGKAGASGVANAIWTPLTRIDPGTKKLVNAVAASVESSDQREWTIKLKSGWTFHNGEKVTAQSFADAWNATAYGPNTMSFSYLLSIIDGYAALNPAKGKPSTDKLSGVKVVDDTTLRVTLTKPLATFPYVLAGAAFAPMPKAAFADLAAYDKLPIGNGPYQVAAPGRAPGAQRLILKRFDDYAGTKGKTAEIVVRTYQDDATAFTDFKAGTLDVATVGGNDLAVASRTYRRQLVRSGAPAVVYLGFPLWDKRFADKRVRQAFSQAIDRNAISKSLLRGFAEPAAGIAPPVLAGGGRSNCAPCGYDPASAKRSLAEAGGWKGPLTLWTTQEPSTQPVLQAVLNQLRTNLGISSITMKAQPTDQLYPNLAAHKTDGPFLLYMGASYPNIYAMADQLLGKGSATNVTGYDGAHFGQLMDQAAQAGSPDQVVTFAQRATDAAMADLPVAPLYYPVGAVVHSQRLGGVRTEYLGDVDLAAVKVKR
jgi:peptide/nickel transport system substrate-binding protein/oligopeptide transport system substrate-binding protein